MSSSEIDRAVETYAAMRPQLVAATDSYVAAVRSIIDEAGINYLTVEGRTKAISSFAGKAVQLAGVRSDFRPLADITDQVGVRVVTYVQGDVQAVAQLLAQQFTVLDDRDLGRETASAGRFGYASRHLLVTRDRSAGAAYDPVQCASVQLRTVLQHAWAEFEHDIRYKGTVPPEQVPELDRRFTLAAGLLELADREFTTIRDRLRTSWADKANPGPDDDPRITAPQLAPFLAGRYASAGWSRTDHYEWIAGLLLELGIGSLDELSEVLREIDSGAVTAAMGYRYPPGAVRRLDDDLLTRFRERYLELTGNRPRAEALRTRLAKLG